MYLGLLREFLFHPDEEYIINRTLNVRGKDVLLLSLTKENDTCSLWVMRKRDLHEELYEVEVETKRDEMLRHIESSNRDHNFFLNQMEIQGNIVEFDTSFNHYVHENNWEAIVKLLHFVELGLIPEEWDNVELENLVITEFRQKEGDYVPVIDTTKDLSILLYIGQDTRQVPILHSFKAHMGKQDMGKKIIYYDKELGKEGCFYINELTSYDPYEDIEKMVKNIENIEERERVLDDLINAIKDYCPRGKNLAIIEYETEDDTQLEFYLKEYLDSKPIIYEDYNEKEPIGRSTGIGFIATTDKDKGINGYKLRASVMQAIDKDYSGELQIELFSRYLIIPEEIVKVL